MARGKSRLGPSAKPPASLITASIDTLTQGVSQQPGHLRQVGQGSKQVNGWSSVVNGLTKRRPTKFVAKVSSTKFEDFYAETMPVSASERYTLLIRPGKDGSDNDVTIAQFFLNGQFVECDVHGQGMTWKSGATEKFIECDSTSYLFNQKDLYNKYVLINNGPQGLLLNREKTVKLETDKSAAQKTDSLLFIEGVNYDVTYSVTINGTAVDAFTTPQATDDPNDISTDTVAAHFQDKINDLADFTATRAGSVVHIVKDDGKDYSISVSDGRSNTLARIIKGQVTSFSQLPTVAPKDFTVKVEGSANTTDDDIWVKFVPRDPGVTFGEGTWDETVAPETQFKLDKDTMPLVVRRAGSKVLFVGPADGAAESITTGGDTFNYTFPKWGERTAGDTTTVPTPSFVDNKIRDHVLFRSRYMVVGGENCICSEVDDIYNFFNDTAITVLDTDPIDVRAASETSIPLEWILPVDEGVLLFSQKSQFQMRPADADVLTARTAVVLRLSNIDMNARVRPRIAGPNVIFATEEYNYTGFREYQFFDTQQRRIGLNLGGNLNLTLNVPKLIDGYVMLWDVGESLDYFVCMTPDDHKKLYVYKYLWRTAQGSIVREQSAWSEWTFDGEIQWLRFFDNKLWLIVTYGDGTYTVHIEAEELTSPTDPEMYLDRQIRFPECNSTPQTSDNITATYDAQDDRTSFELPYDVTGDTDIIVRYDETKNKGLILGTLSSGKKADAVIRGDFRTTKLLIGRRYKFEYEFTQAYKPTKDQSRQRIIGELHGRLQVVTWQINHFNTGNYTLRIKRTGRANDSVHKFRGVILDVQNNKLTTEDAILDTGSFRVPVYCKNTDTTVSVESEDWTPVTLMSCQWEGNFNDRAKGVMR